MDHEIEHHIDIRAALFERREALALDEACAGELGLGGDDRRVEAFEMPDLQDPPAARRDRDQLARLRDGLGDGLLDQHMRARLEEIPRDGEMRRGGRDHADRVHLAEELTMVGDRRGAELERQGLAGFGPGIRHGDQATTRLGGIFLRVEAAEVSRADHCCPDVLHALLCTDACHEHRC